MRLLHLNVHRKWFDMILSGEKKEEYREITEYWSKRLIEEREPHGTDMWIDPKPYDAIVFSNGYAKNRPQITVEYKGLEQRFGNPEWGAPDHKVWVLKLGCVLKGGSK